MRKGENRANGAYKIKSELRKVFDNFSGNITHKNSTPCIFLSHKNEDKDACLEIAKYLEEVGIDYYLDIFDNELQFAAAQSDPIKITTHIKNGIYSSSHMVVVISEKTKDSKWVPFEIGYGHASIVDKNIQTLKDDKIISLAYLTLKDASDIEIPDFLQIAHPIRGIKSLNEYLELIKPSEVELKKYFNADPWLENILQWDK